MNGVWNGKDDRVWWQGTLKTQDSDLGLSKIDEIFIFFQYNYVIYYQDKYNKLIVNRAQVVIVVVLK